MLSIYKLYFFIASLCTLPPVCNYSLLNPPFRPFEELDTMCTLTSQRTSTPEFCKCVIRWIEAAGFLNHGKAKNSHHFSSQCGTTGSHFVKAGIRSVCTSSKKEKRSEFDSYVMTCWFWNVLSTDQWFSHILRNMVNPGFEMTSVIYFTIWCYLTAFPQWWNDSCGLYHVCVVVFLKAQLQYHVFGIFCSALNLWFVFCIWWTGSILSVYSVLYIPLHQHQEPARNESSYYLNRDFVFL